jgi:hypothetical protein
MNWQAAARDYLSIYVLLLHVVLKTDEEAIIPYFNLRSRNSLESLSKILVISHSSIGIRTTYFPNPSQVPEPSKFLLLLLIEGVQMIYK